MSKILEELEPICYESVEMTYLLKALSKASEQSRNDTDIEVLNKNHEEMSLALSLVSKIQDRISDRMWDIFYELEEIDKQTE